jgi:hypothetical protein
MCFQKKTLQQRTGLETQELGRIEMIRTKQLEKDQIGKPGNAMCLGEVHWYSESGWLRAEKA